MIRVFSFFMIFGLTGMVFSAEFTSCFAYFENAKSYIKYGNLEKAADAYKKIISADVCKDTEGFDGNKEIRKYSYQFLAQIYLKDGATFNLQNAFYYSEEGLKYFPQNNDLKFYKSKALFYRAFREKAKKNDYLKDINESDVILNELISKGRESGASLIWVYNQTGLNYILKEDFENAINIFEEAGKIDKKESVVVKNLFIAKIKYSDVILDEYKKIRVERKCEKSKLEKAKKYLQDALKVSTENAEFKSHKENIESSLKRLKTYLKDPFCK